MVEKPALYKEREK